MSFNNQFDNDNSKRKDTFDLPGWLGRQKQAKWFSSWLAPKDQIKSVSAVRLVKERHLRRRHPRS